MAGNNFASVGQRTNAFAAPAGPKLPSTQPMAGFGATQKPPKMRAYAAPQLQRPHAFGAVPRSKFGIIASGLK